MRDDRLDLRPRGTSSGGTALHRTQPAQTLVTISRHASAEAATPGASNLKRCTAGDSIDRPGTPIRSEGGVSPTTWEL